MALEIKLLRHGDEAVLANVAASVFDYDINEQLTKEFLGDARHHLAVAAVGVAPTHQGRGIGKALLRALFEAGRETGCLEA